MPDAVTVPEQEVLKGEEVGVADEEEEDFPGVAALLLYQAVPNGIT